MVRQSVRQSSPRPPSILLCLTLTFLALACTQRPPGLDPKEVLQSDLGIAIAIADCFGTHPDLDDDRLADTCESQLASAFAPLLVFDSAACNIDRTVTPSRPGGEYLFGAQPTATSAVRIAYLPAYYADCGWTGAKCVLTRGMCRGHSGDSEMIAIDIVYDSVAVRWRTEAIFLSAHCFGRSAGGCRWRRGEDLREFGWVDDVQRGAPIVWVASGSNANYATRDACDAGHYHFDTCDGNARAIRFPILAERQNIGSRTQPFLRAAPDGCITASHVGWDSRLPDALKRECIWSESQSFRGWASSPEGDAPTPYGRYLREVLSF